MNQKPLLDAISRLHEQFAQQKLTAFEADNILHDLKELEARFLAGQYQQTDYLARNTFDLPRRTEEFLIYMQGFEQVSQTWAEILRPIISDKTQTVLDLCPGWAPKIELALNKLDFSGTVFLWDVDTTSTQRVIDYMKLFNISFHISQIKTDLFTSTTKTKSDLVVANHILDDLLLHDYCKRNGCVLTSLYDSEEKMLAAISATMSKKEIQHEIATKLINVVEENLAVGGYFIISQYAGLFEKANNLDQWVSFCKEILHFIKAELENRKYFDSTNIISEMLSKSDSVFFNGEDMFCLRR